MSDNTEKENEASSWSLHELTDDERRNMLGFFELLLAVDKRTNPQLYQNYDGHRDTYNSKRSV